jgi:hypothetical protein
MKTSKPFVEGIVDILVRDKALSHDRALTLKKTFFDRSKIAFDTFLLEEGLIDRAQLLKALGEYFQVQPFDVVGNFFERHYLQMFPKDFLLRNIIIPLERDEVTLIVIAGDPNNPELLSRIGEHVSYDIRFMVGLDEDIIDAVQEYYDKSLTEVDTSGDTDDLRLERKETEEAGKLLYGDEEPFEEE